MCSYQLKLKLDRSNRKTSLGHVVMV